MHHFKQVYDCVENYFKTALNKGRTVSEIMNSFREDPLPVELTICNFRTDELRRHGQLVSTKYIVDQRRKESIRLPYYDPLNVE